MNAFEYGGSNAHLIVDDALHYLKEHHLVGKHKTIEFPQLDSKQLVQNGTNDINSSNGTNGHSSHDLNDYSNDINSSNETNGHSSHGLNDYSNDINSSNGTNGHSSHGLNGYSNGISNGTASSASSDEESLSTRLRAFVFSTFDETGAARIAAVYQAYLSSYKTLVVRPDEEESFLNDLAGTLANHRTEFPWRFSVVADSVGNLADKLACNPAPTRIGSDPLLGFVFTGQGAQWYAMGRELLLAYPKFNASVFAADLYLRKLGCPWSLVGKFASHSLG